MKPSITNPIHEFFCSLGCTQLSGSVPDYWHQGVHLAFLYVDEYTSDLESISFPPQALVIVIGTRAIPSEDLLKFDDLSHETVRITDLGAFIANRAFGEEHIDWRETVEELQSAEGKHEHAEMVMADAQDAFDSAQQKLEFAQEAWACSRQPQRFRPVVIA
ncbi:hypothetical protein [Duganella callida]|uniref:Uncharacterized protein n=1 Tax=Duganella callida TaxID=2561932 RepID=A0A4Y9SCX5_9BURK|nr:hypothetical protein [Duganella callida]TFW17560.1 hypothetical protein E4L98_20360 [Duganella callida]